jgi:hypothetical protein
MSQSLANIAQAWLEKDAERDAAEEARDEYGHVLGRRAYTILRDNHQIRRTGQYPSVIAVKGDRVTFEVTNGIDYGDDFTVTYTIEQLETSDRLFSPSELA